MPNLPSASRGGSVGAAPYEAIARITLEQPKRRSNFDQQAPSGMPHYVTFYVQVDDLQASPASTTEIIVAKITPLFVLLCTSRRCGRTWWRSSSSRSCWSR